MENETDEQFEERVLNKRAAQMFVSVRTKLHKQDSILLSEMTYRNNRKQVSCLNTFFSLLSLFLKKNQSFYFIVFFFSHTLGRTKVLFAACTKEIPSVRDQTR